MKLGKGSGIRKERPPVVIEALESRQLLSSAAGPLDIEFGDNGIVHQAVGISVGTETATAMAIQPDGQSLVVGNLATSGGTSAPFVYRYQPDGSLDRTFGDQGRALLHDDHSNRRINAVALQDDGRIILAGSENGAFLAYRLNADGSLDQTFGVAGVYKSVPTGILSGEIHAAAVLPNGQILLAGSLRQYTGLISYDAAFVRLTPDGLPELSYANQGTQAFWLTDAADAIHALKVLPDGSVLAAGTAGGDFLLLKLDAAGELDLSFGNGRDVGTLTNLGHRAETARSIALLPGGDIVLAGDSMNDVFVARYTATGKPVRTFGSGNGLFAGTVRIDLRGIDHTTSVSISPDGRIVVLGTATGPAPGASRPFATRFNARGRFDRTFGIRGAGRIDPASFAYEFGASRLSAAAPAADGSIYYASTSINRASGDVAVLRMSPEGRTDYTFSRGDSITNAPATTRAVASTRQSDGKILTAILPIARDRRMVITRFNPDGSIDATFGDHGTTRLDFPDDPAWNDSSSVDMLVDSAGRVVIANDTLQLTRLMPNGNVDLTFGSAGIASLQSQPAAIVSRPSLAIQDDAILVGVGVGPAEIVLARYNDVGQLDAAFGNAGIARVDLAARVAPPPDDPWSSTPHLELSNIFVDPVGRIHAIGRIGRLYPFWSTSKMFDLRTSSTGQIDSSFADQGFFSMQIDGPTIATAAAILADGRIAIGAFNQPGGGGEGGAPMSTAVVLLHDDGTLDPTFGNNSTGIQRVPFSDDTIYYDDVPSAVFANPDGSLVLAGAARGSTSDSQGGNYQHVSALTLTKLTPAGHLDQTFGTAGRFVTPIEAKEVGEVTVLSDSADHLIFVASDFHQEIALTRLEISTGAIG